jgi:hypothetical protein
VENFIFSLIGFFLVLNFNVSIPHPIFCVQLPHPITRSVSPAGIVLGNDVDGSYPRVATSPLGQVNSIDTKEQSLNPELFISSSKYETPAVLTAHFSVFNKCGLALSSQKDFNSATPLMPPQNTAIPLIAPEAYPFQNPQSTSIEIPSEYIFYQYGFFVLGFLVVLDVIIWFVRLVCQVHNSLISYLCALVAKGLKI